MDLFTTLDEAISVAKETFLADHPEVDELSASVSQFSLQKYVMQDGDTMWQAEFADQEEAPSECLPLYFDEAAQAIWNNEFDEDEILAEWQPENTLHEWDEGEFQLAPPTDTEEGRAAAEEWNDDNSDSERW
ncbi:MysB family protein [Rosenbergiella epipactidis]|uniref:MysB family protein n=1 Tax=Rosenbergiella epipactidis TaxID=1544694 RepID=UPI00066459DB|nr:MysB family protein [Rosenbergiella epipactidis]KMV73574.1 secY/secA suppressor protein [bacteria symbiont BFo2 of Frankliniella occidentalis]KYP96180.1 secY/secA suppressor protein [bacteria symbiont BFo2 of Frankliniella occidentalis]